jgi:Fe-S cluster assembly ATPase SufC
MKKSKFKSKIVEINVTAKDIKNGEPAEPSFCPIALAVQRKIKKAQGVTVDKYLDYWTNMGAKACSSYFKGELPKKARKFITLYDRSFVLALPKKLKNVIKPFKFKLKITQVY